MFVESDCKAAFSSYNWEERAAICEDIEAIAGGRVVAVALIAGTAVLAFMAKIELKNAEATEAEDTEATDADETLATEETAANEADETLAADTLESEAIDADTLDSEATDAT